MTDREKLIELLLGRKEVVSEVCENTSCKTCQYEKYGFNCDKALFADHLIANGVTVQEWIPASIPPTDYRDEHGELIPFLVCEEGTEYPFRAMYDGKTWGDGLFAVPATHWMPLPQPPKGE